jgi:hypothetical protein
VDCFVATLLAMTMDRIKRHCERSEAIQRDAGRRMDCLVAAPLAMTGSA